MTPEPLRVICPWCPDWDRTDPRNAGASHTICPACQAKIDAQLAVLEQAQRHADAA